MYLDIHKLLCESKEDIKNKSIKKWKTFDALSKYAERTDNVALINKIKVCNYYV